MKITENQEGIKQVIRLNLFTEKDEFLRESNLGVVEQKVFYSDTLYAILPIPLFTLGIKHKETDIDRFIKIYNYLSQIDTKYIRNKFKALPLGTKELLPIKNVAEERLFINKIKAEVTGQQREVSRIIKEIQREIDERIGGEKLHKQPRNLLKTVGQNISNNTETPTLFTLPQKAETGGGALGDLKEELSKNTGALAIYLMQKYQENNSKPLEITNLNQIAEVMNCNNYRLKIFLLYLGGYVYPIIDKDEITKELVLTNEQLFRIEFRYSKKVADKYEVNKNNEIQGVERIGTDILSFIKDEPLDRVIITPNPRFVKALEGKGLGNILTVNNKFVGLILELTDIATKILCYSSANKPSHKIGEDNLVKHLGLTKQIKKQGKPRVRATILKGLQELQDKGHIKSYSYSDATGMYSYIYSDKYVKYREPKRERKEEIKGVQ